MFQLRQPTDAQVRALLEKAGTMQYSYPEVGRSRHGAPPGYAVDHNRICIGQGALAFGAARAAIDAWAMFDIGWTFIHPRSAPTSVGTEVVVVIRHLGFWSLNPSRIVYTIEETGEVERYGFAYGTLSEHAEMGEERFTVEWHRSDNSVWYDLYAFSRPRHPLARIGKPVTRMLQKRFARESKERMRERGRAEGGGRR